MTCFENLRRRFINFCIQTLWRWEREVLSRGRNQAAAPLTLISPWTTYDYSRHGTENSYSGWTTYGYRLRRSKPDDNVS